MSDTFHWLDHLVVLGYLAVSIGLGIYLRGQSTREEFFQASGSMGRMTVGLSVMATLFSANSFMMYPSTSYAVSLTAGAAVIAFWAMAPVVIWVFIPVYSRLKCKTAYEYLEQRFHVSVRCLASGLFILLRIGWMASATYAASVAISGISGVGQVTVIISLGTVAVFYTMLGGLRAVMWTDVLQFFVFAGTIVFAMGLLISQADGGFSGIVETYTKGRDNLIVNFAIDPKLRFATFAMLIGSFLEGLSAFGADQVAVQRYIAAKDEKTSQSGFLINMLGLSFIVPSLLCIGAGLFAYFHHHPENLEEAFVQGMVRTSIEKSSEQDPNFVISDQERSELDRFYRDGMRATVKNSPDEAATIVHELIVETGMQDQALPTFVRLKFPPGVVGLLVAALMAATMSSIDSGIHSVTTAIVVDFRDRLFPGLRPATDAGEMRIARIILVIIGALAVGLACFVGDLGDVFDVAKKTTAAFGGGVHRRAVYAASYLVRSPAGHLRRSSHHRLADGRAPGLVFALVLANRILLGNRAFDASESDSRGENDRSRRAAADLVIRHAKLEIRSLTAGCFVESGAGKLSRPSVSLAPPDLRNPYAKQSIH